MPRSMLIDDVRDVLRRRVGITDDDLSNIEANGFVEDGCDFTNIDVRPATPYYVTNRDKSSAAISPAVTDSAIFVLLTANVIAAYVHPAIYRASQSAVNSNSPTGHIDAREVAKRLMDVLELERRRARAAAEEILGRGLSMAAIATDGLTQNPNRRAFSVPANLALQRENLLSIDNVYATTSRVLDDWGWRNIGEQPLAGVVLE